jgi:hypothetical protein
MKPLSTIATNLPPPEVCVLSKLNLSNPEDSCLSISQFVMDCSIAVKGLSLGSQPASKSHSRSVCRIVREQGLFPYVIGLRRRQRVERDLLSKEAGVLQDGMGISFQ